MRLLALNPKKIENVLEREPYRSFLEQFEKQDRNINDRPITIQIISQDTNNKSFTLDSCYTTQFDLKFQAFTLLDEKSKKTKCNIIHTISFKFDPSFFNVMSNLIEDINSKNGCLYLSFFCQDIQMEGYMNVNTVSIAFNVYCQKEHIKEICLELISQDIAIFSRSF